MTVARETVEIHVLLIYRTELTTGERYEDDVYNEDEELEDNCNVDEERHVTRDWWSEQQGDVEEEQDKVWDFVNITTISLFLTS